MQTRWRYTAESESGPSACCEHVGGPNLKDRCYRSPRLPAILREPRPCEIPVRCAVYARVSTLDQEPENQLAELRRYVAARGWDAAVEYVDHGVSGAKDKRPALDRLVKDAKRRKFDVLVTWKLDRLGRNLKHLITLLEDLRPRAAYRSTGTVARATPGERRSRLTRDPNATGACGAASAITLGSWRGRVQDRLSTVNRDTGGGTRLRRRVPQRYCFRASKPAPSESILDTP